MAADRGGTVSVATYNVHSCVGSDGRKEPERIARVLAALDCDVVALQEVESHGPPDAPTHQLGYLSRRTGYHAVAGPTLWRAEGDYGNALLTRKRILDVARRDLSVSGREPRGVLDVLIEIGRERLRFLVTHLGLAPAERRSQIAILLEMLGSDAETPTVLLGDFNEWFPWSRSRRLLRRRLGDIPMPPTFPSRFPLFSLDHVWVRPRSALRALDVVAAPETRLASDHLPVRARIDLGSPGELSSGLDGKP